jgi:outer membrane protein TolC
MRTEFYISKLLLIILIVLISEICHGETTGPDSLSLNEAIKLAIQNYPLIKQQQEKIKAAEYRIDEQKSFYYPDIRGEADYARIGPLPSFVFGGEELILAPADNYNIQVGLNQQIFDFGKRDASIELMKSYKQSASDNVDLIKSNLTYQTLQTFYSILFLQQSISVKDTQIAALNAHLDVTNKKVQTGTATDYDALSTQVRISQAQSEKIELINQLKQQQIILNELLGIPQDTTLTIKGDFIAPSNIMDIDSLTSVAFQKRPELKLAEDELNSSRLQEHIADLSNMPNLGAHLSYGFKNGYEPNIFVLRGNWVAAVSVDVPIFNGFLTSDKVSEAEANSSAAVQNIITIKRTIFSDVQQAMSNLNSNLDKLKSTLTQVNFAQETVQRSIARYDSGVGTNLDLLDAETSLAQAKLFYLQDLFRSILSSYQLKKAVGDVLN